MFRFSVVVVPQECIIMISIPVFQCCLFLWNQYNVLPNMEFLSFRALCVTTASLENQNFFPHTNPYHDFALGSPVLHVTVEDVRSDCFHYSPMKGSKSAGTVNRTSAPCQRFFFCQGFAACGFGLRPTPKRHAREKNVCSLVYFK